MGAASAAKVGLILAPCGTTEIVPPLGSDRKSNSISSGGALPLASLVGGTDEGVRPYTDLLMLAEAGAAKLLAKV